MTQLSLVNNDPNKTVDDNLKEEKKRLEEEKYCVMCNKNYKRSEWDDYCQECIDESWRQAYKKLGLNEKGYKDCGDKILVALDEDERVEIPKEKVYRVTQTGLPSDSPDYNHVALIAKDNGAHQDTYAIPEEVKEILVKELGLNYRMEEGVTEDQINFNGKETHMGWFNEKYDHSKLGSEIANKKEKIEDINKEIQRYQKELKEEEQELKQLELKKKNEERGEK